MTARFTIDGSSDLEAHLSRTCAAVADAVKTLIPVRRLEGVVLGGGYGRGEGGVLRTASGDQPYNDLEFFIFVRGSTILNDLRYKKALHELGHHLTRDAGIEVEFKVLSLEKLRRSRPGMSYYDLLMGHRWIVGGQDLFQGCSHHQDAAAIPMHEATRLLMNRCSGLLYARERLTREHLTQEDLDFITRNIAKAQLALGDVILTVHGQYHYSCLERGRRLLALAPQGMDYSLYRHHAAGIQFKLHPFTADADREKLAALHAEVEQLAKSVWLWLEGRRLGRNFRSVQCYAGNPESICPETAPWKNAALNLRHFGFRSLLEPSRLRYPRERLLRSLPLLLWGMTSSDESAMVSACLGCPGPTLGEAVQAYTKIWNSFN